MTRPQKYTLEEPVRGEQYHASYGLIAYEFPAGEVTPKSEGEELVLEELVALGLAVKAEGKASKEKERRDASEESR